MIGAVVLAVNPLSPSTIVALLDSDLDDISPLLSLLHSLLIFGEGADHPVQPFHKSFIVDPVHQPEEYLRDVLVFLCQRFHTKMSDKNFFRSNSQY